jgi:hypothetical protein
VFALNLPPPHQVDEEYLASVRRVIARVLDTRKRRGNRAGNQAIIDEIGVRVRFERDESYCREALDYHLGLLYAHLGDPDMAAHHIDRSGAHPGSGGNQLFSDHQSESLALRRRQELAKERDIPSILMASMPRSASASLTQTIAAVLDIPVLRASCGRFPDFFLIPRWFDSAKSGGAIFHDHFAANPFNLGMLRDAQVNEIFVRIRDPRSATCSAESLVEREAGDRPEISFEDRVLARYEQAFVPWLISWIAVAADPAAGLTVRWIRYGASSDEIRNTARVVLLALSGRHPALAGYAVPDIPIVEANYVGGNDEAWRAKISQPGQERLWRATPDAIRELLTLRR